MGERRVFVAFASRELEAVCGDGRAVGGRAVGGRHTSAASGVRLAGVAILVAASLGCGDGGASPSGAPAASGAAPQAAAVPESRDERIRKFCATCHLFPSPDTLPRDLWKARIESMYEIVQGTSEEIPDGIPPIEDALAFYNDHALEKLPDISHTVDRGDGRLRLERFPLKVPQLDPFPGVSMARFVRLFDGPGLDLLVCEMRFGLLFAVRPYRSKNAVTVIGKVQHPCTAEVVDLDRDGRKDLLVSDLGTITPSDTLNGALWWLRGREDGGFETVPLLRGVGRVASSQAADFDGDGDLDIVVAIFGWRKVGEIVVLFNDAKPSEAPRFTTQRVDPRPGAIHVPVTDLDGDGSLDFVALISQQHEMVVAFLNDGSGEFRAKELFRAPHPNWGSTGIQLVDLDQDGDQDVLFSNGDTLDDLLPKPYHGIQWLENRGDLEFESHRITLLYGCNSAKAADLDGDGDLDIVASVFLPYVRPETPNAELTESVVWLEQVEPGRFERWSLETVTCVHPCLDVGDFDLDGDIDFVTGNMTMGQTRPGPLDTWYTLWENQTR